MARAPRISPFRGLLYSPEKVQGLAAVMAPPYDVISPELQQRLYDRHPHNIVRLILPQSSAGEGEGRYLRAAKDLESWIREGTLVRDGRPVFYIYEQEFLDGGHRLKRRGLIGLLRLEPFGRGIRRHEATLSAPKEDRLRLIQHCRTNLSPVFSLYEDPAGEIAELIHPPEEPAIDLVDDEQACHRLWRVTEAKRIRAISARLAEKTLLVADGHHRYETALTYRDQLRKEQPGAPEDASFEYVMMYFLDTADPGLRIGPTHRVLSVKGMGESLLARLRENFEIESFREHPGEFLEALRDLKVRGFGLALSRDHRLHLVMDPQCRTALDVQLVHDVFLRKVVGLSAEEEKLTYTHSMEEALSLVQAGHDRIGILLKPPTAGEIFAVAGQGGVLPPKTTYFYPKLLSGLVLHPLSPEERVTI